MIYFAKARSDLFNKTYTKVEELNKFNMITEIYYMNLTLKDANKK